MNTDNPTKEERLLKLFKDYGEYTYCQAYFAAKDNTQQSVMFFNLAAETKRKFQEVLGESDHQGMTCQGG